MKTFLRMMVRSLIKFTESDGWELVSVTEFDESTDIAFELRTPYQYITASNQLRQIGAVEVTLKMKGVRDV